MSHEMKQFVIDGSKCILNKPTPDQKVEDGEFEENEVYAVDIVVSSGEGKPRVSTRNKHMGAGGAGAGKLRQAPGAALVCGGWARLGEGYEGLWTARHVG